MIAKPMPLAGFETDPPKYILFFNISKYRIILQ